MQHINIDYVRYPLLSPDTNVTLATDIFINLRRFSCKAPVIFVRP